MPIKAEYILVAVAVVFYGFGMFKMIFELHKYKDKEERKRRLIIPMMVSMTVLFTVFVVQTFRVLKYLF